MIGTIIGALIGEDLDPDDKPVGALIGIATVGLLKRAVPLAIIGAGILVAKHYIDKAQAEL